jgi:hypothetical protein
MDSSESIQISLDPLVTHFRDALKEYLSDEGIKKRHNKVSFTSALEMAQRFRAWVGASTRPF